MKNRVLLLSVLITATIASARKLTQRTYHDEVRQLCDTTLLIDRTEHPAQYKAIEVRGKANVTDRQGDAAQYFGVVWNALSPHEYYAAILQCGNDAFDHYIDSPYTSLHAIHHTTDSIIELGNWRIKSDISHGKKENSLAVEMDATENSVKLLAGNKTLHLIQQLTFDHDVTTGKMGILTNGCTDISLLVTENATDPLSVLATSWSLHSLEDYFTSGTRDDIEGFWQYLDRDNDDRYCRLGGDYTVAIVKSGDGYDIIYADGAKINSPQWHAGMRKGHLTPTIFSNHYDLTWYDSTFQPISDECHATFEHSAIIALNFPLLKSSVRFSKMPTGK